MSDLIKKMMERRSCRSYKPDPVPEVMLDEIIQAGLYAPSGMGKQSPIIISVTDKDTRDMLSRLNASVINAPAGMDPFYGAPAVLIVLADKSVPTYIYDGSVAMENMLLAADSLGLGSCWIHRAKEEFEDARMKAFLKKLGAEGDYEGIGHCIVGYPASQSKPAAPRNEGRVYKVK